MIENYLAKIQKMNIKDIESEMLKHEQIECPVIHRFGPGVYIREVKLYAGSVVVGHHQNFEHQNIFLQGKMTLLMDGDAKEIKAPMMFVAGPGRKIAYIHEDCVFLNIYPNIENEQSIGKLEEKFLTKSEEFSISESQKNSLLIGMTEQDRKDYNLVLNSIGLTDEQAKKISEKTDDLIELPYGAWKIKIAKSPIEGLGLFATSDLDDNENIAPAKINGKRTMAGRYANHSANPNAKRIMKNNGDIDLVAIKKIQGCRGGFDGQEITVDYRDLMSFNNLRGSTCVE